MPWLWADSRGRALLRAFFALTATLLFSAPAFSAEAKFALTWHSDAKAPCITEAALQASVERKLRAAPFVEYAAAELRIEGEERAPDDAGNTQWRARIAQRDRGGVLLGERRIAAKSCESLLRAATFVVALFIDPEGDQEPAAEEDVSLPPASERPLPASPPLPPPRASTRPKPSPRSKSLPPFDLKLGVGASAVTGLLPSMSGAVLVMARLERRSSPWSFDWSGAYSWPQTIYEGTIRGEFAGVQQRARACFAFLDRETARIEACGGALWGAVMPRTTGVLAASEAWKPVIGPTAAVALELRTGNAGTAGRLEAGLAVPVERFSFSYLSNAGEPKVFYTTGGVVVFIALAGLQSIFP